MFVTIALYFAIRHNFIHTFYVYFTEFYTCCTSLNFVMYVKEWDLKVMCKAKISLDGSW